MLLTTVDGRVLRANAAACRALGRSHQELLQCQRADLIVLTDTARALLAEREATGSVAGEGELRRGDGTTFPAELSSGLLSDAGERRAYVMFRDISERRRGERALARSHRALRLLAECDAALTRATNESELFDDICNAVVEVGGYRMAWVGLAMHDAQRSVSVAARAGHDAGFLESADVVWSDTPRGRGPAGTAIRSGLPAETRDIASDPRLEPWRDAARARDYASCIALPLMHESSALGALIAISTEVAAFDSAEVEILTQLADRFSLGIQALRSSAAHAAADAALRSNEALLKCVTDTIPDPIFMKDAQSRWLFVNPATLAALDRSLEDVLGKRDSEIYGESPLAAELEAVDRRVMQTGVTEVLEESVPTPEGIRKYLTTKAPFRDASGEIRGVVGVGHDITEREHLAQEVQRSRALFFDAFRNSPAPMTIVQVPSGCYLEVNDACLRMVGCEREEMLGRSAVELGLMA